MLRTYGPGCDGSVIESNADRIPDGSSHTRPTANEVSAEGSGTPGQ